MFNKDTATEVLKRVVYFLNTGEEEEAQRLWDILSALRGPDDMDNTIKAATTGVIRHACGIDGTTLGITTCFDAKEAVEIRQEMEQKTGNAHFLLHAKKAFVALGLRWNEVNTSESLVTK